MDTMQAAILLAKLPHLEEWIKARNQVAVWYRRYLKEEILHPFVPDAFHHVYHLYVIRTKSRDALMRALDDAAVGYAVHYPTPLPFVKAYLYQGNEYDDFPVAHRLSKEILSLPVFPELTEAQVKQVCDLVNEVA